MSEVDSKDRIAELELEAESLRSALNAKTLELQNSGALVGDIEALKLENEELKSKLAASNKIAEELQSKIVTSGSPSISGLPESAAQLSESVKIENAHVRSGIKDPKDAHTAGVFAKDGDVVIAGDEKALKSLQAKLGSSTTVHPISKDTLAELKRLGFVRK